MRLIGLMLKLDMVSFLRSITWLQFEGLWNQVSMHQLPMGGRVDWERINVSSAVGYNQMLMCTCL